MEKNILIIDSDISLKKVLLKALSNSKTIIHSVSSISEAWVKISKNFYDLVITDVKLPDGDGLELVEKLTEKKTNTKIIIISAKNNLLTAIKANELDVFEYMPKPIDLNDLTIIVSRALQKKNKTPEVYIDEEKLPIIGNSFAMQSVYRTIAKLNKTDLTVLITGESGTGKELVAKALHDFSERSNENFVVLNMAAIPKELIESELFGYEKGAFTGAEKTTIGYFEKAERGTLFLDEIGDMPIHTQSKILRTLQSGEFSRVGGNENLTADVRILAATNKDLEFCVKNGEFREDLFYRLNVVRVHIPPLRQRIEDIKLLAEFFLKRNAEQKKAPKLRLSSESIELLEAYHWPGNVRELENTLYRASLLSTADVLLPKDIPLGNLDSDNISTSQNLESTIKESISSLKKASGKKPLMAWIETEFAKSSFLEHEKDLDLTSNFLGISVTRLKELLKN